VSPVPKASTLADVLAAAASGAARRVPGAMATVVARHGSAPGTPGQKLYLGGDGVCVGTVGGGAIEREVLDSLSLLTSRGGSVEVRTFKLGAELGMCCGGRLTVMIEPLATTLPCFIVGAGHVSGALAPLLVTLGFDVTVADAREEWARADRFLGARVVVGDWDEAGRDADPRGVCLVMTHDHGLDQEAIGWALKKGFRFVGGIGSRAKAERTRQRLTARGFAEADVARVRMPLGVVIGARSPEEIAVAVAAELIAWRRGRSEDAGADHERDDAGEG
jgi:xanthine dehydrogenase accessory factor